MEIYGVTNVGLKRVINQDYWDMATLCDGAATLAIVCDGLGGHKAGEVASKMAVETVKDYVTRSFTANMNAQQIENMLRTSLCSANTLIYEAAQKDESYEGMGTTAVLFFVYGGVAYILHAGDSRAYLYRDGQLKQITVDHSLVQSMVDKGELTPEEALVHPRKNIIVRCLGTKPETVADIDFVDLKENDILLLCSDGLSSYTGAENIASALADFGPDTTEKLIDFAKEGGGGDNITAVVLKY